MHRLVNQVSWENWARYTNEREVVERMHGQLMRYPVEVGGDNSLWSLTEHEFFPDMAYLLTPLRSNIMFTHK